MSNKKDKRNKSSRGVTVVIIICAVVVSAFVFVLLFSDMVIGNAKMAETRKKIAECEDILISDPLYEGGKLPTGADALIKGDQAKELADSFLEVTEKLSYQRMISGKTGFWDLSIEFTVDGERYTVYLKEDSVYVAKGNGYLFVIGEKNTAAYSEFYKKVNHLLYEKNS